MSWMNIYRFVIMWLPNIIWVYIYVCHNVATKLYMGIHIGLL